MVICIVAAIVFGILGIFSAKYRAYAKEAFRCAFRTVTLRKCDTGLDEKIKAKVTASTLKYSPPLARAIHTHFTLISWIFVLLMFASGAYTAVSLYNYFAFGNCNGPVSGEICLIDVMISGQKFSSCGTAGVQGNLSFPKTLNGHSLGNENARVVIVEFGCFACQYTKKAEPEIMRLVNDYQSRVYYVFKFFPASHANEWDAAEAAECASEQGKYWEYRAKVFERQDELKQGTGVLFSIADEIGLNKTRFSGCFYSDRYLQVLNASYDEGITSGVYGTPTFFINNRTFVGYTSYDALKSAVEEELRK